MSGVTQILGEPYYFDSARLRAQLGTDLGGDRGRDGQQSNRVSDFHDVRTLPHGYPGSQKR